MYNNMTSPLRGEDLEKLFLLELFVDKIEFNWNAIDIEKEVLATLKQTCIRFQFLNYPVLEVCEEDFCETNENQEENSVVLFKCGKSCLFSLRSVIPELRCFMIRATVLRKKDTPPHHVLGKACIGLGESFVNIINSVQSGNDGHITETVKDKYSIRIPNGTEIGKLTMLVRLSCFGKMIITQFQITDEEKKTFFFKGDETKLTAAVGDGSPPNFSINQVPFYGEEGMIQHTPNIPYETLTTVASRDPGMNQGFTHLGNATNVSPFGDHRPFQTPPHPSMPQMSGMGMHGMGIPGVVASSMGMQGMGMQGMVKQGTSMPGMGMLGTGVPGMGMSGTGMPGMGMQGIGMQGMGVQGMGIPGTGMQGMGMHVMGMSRMPQDLLGGAGGLLGGSPFAAFANNFPSYPPMGLLGGNSEALIGPPGYAPMDYSRPVSSKTRNRNYPNFPFCGAINRTDDSSSSEEEDEEPTPPPINSFPPLNLCDCDYPLPPSFGMPCSAPPTPKKKKKKKKKKPKCPLELGNNFCFKPNCPMGYPSFGAMQVADCTQMQMPPNTIALKEDQVIFQIPPYAPPSYPWDFSPQWDPTDMYSMKVGRRVNAHDQNTKVELQFEPPPKKMICKMDVETQYMPADFGGAVEGGDKGGKKGKGKGGKKGGKKGKK